jgi:hypothetical protein
MLPASVRGTLADRLDPRLSAILAISIMLHFALAVYAKYFVDPVVDQGLAERAYNLTFKQDTVEIRLEEPVQADPGSAAAGSAEPEKPAPKPKVDDAGRKKDDDGGRPKEDPVALAEQAAARARMLVGEDDGPLGFEDDGGRRSPGQDLKKQLEEVRDSGKDVKFGTSGRGTRGDGDPRVGTGKGPGVGTGGVDSAGGNKAEQGPSGRISVADKAGLDDSSLSPDAVLAKIMSAYMTGLKRCYKDYLKKDPSARGKVQLSFTVNETGRSVSNKAKGFAGEVDACIQSRMAGWRFPIPKDADGEVTDASFQIALQLVPD